MAYGCCFVISFNFNKPHCFRSIHLSWICYSYIIFSPRNFSCCSSRYIFDFTRGRVRYKIAKRITFTVYIYNITTNNSLDSSASTVSTKLGIICVQNLGHPLQCLSMSRVISPRMSWLSVELSHWADSGSK